MLPYESVRYGLIFLAACVPLTYLDITPVANLHFSGLGYGLSGRRVFQQQEPWRVPARWSFYAANLVNSGRFYYVQNPVWSGLYHWHYSRERARNQQERMVHLRRSVILDPGLELAWIDLSKEALRRGDLRNAWTTALLGVQNNPSGTKVIQHTKRLGRTFRTKPQWEQARTLLNEVFDDQAAAWEKQFLAQAPTQFPFKMFDVHAQPATDPDTELPFQTEQELGREFFPPQPPAHLKPPDPDEEDSAAVGAAT